MTNQEILKNVIKKIGVNIFTSSEVEKWAIINPLNSDMYLSIFIWDRRPQVFDGDQIVEKKLYWQQIIFTHEFAKAFFGIDEWYTTECTCKDGPMRISLQEWHDSDCKKSQANRGWDFHLSKMVLEEDPIKYLEQFLNDNSEMIESIL